jgi:hypothetical protein
MNNFLKQEYCKEFGYGYFKKGNKSDYSNWLEKKLIEARTQVEIPEINQLLIQRVVGRSEQLSQKSKNCVSISREPCRHKGVCEICS